MSLSHHQQRHLHRIETGLLRSALQLAGMPGVFGRLAAGEAMPAWEQVSSRQQSIWRAAALIVKANILVAETIVLLLMAVLALLNVVGARHGHRLPAPRPERTRPGRRADGGGDPARQAYGR
jgi:hypothetical protein